MSPSPDNAFHLEVEGLDKRFPGAGESAVEGVSFGARRGEFVTLLGPSGCGKSTTLRIIAGFETPDRGRVLIGGREVTTVPPNRRGVGMVFQSYALFPNLSVRENVAFGLRLRRRPDAEVRGRVDELLALVRLADLADRPPHQLSGGQQQRVALARALAIEPEVLLLDEPLAALDLQTRREVRGELRDLVAGLPGVTLFVTHSPFEAMAFGDHIAVLERGRIVQLGGRDELLHHPRSRYVAELMGLNFFHGRVVAVSADGIAEVQAAHGALHVLDVGPGEEVFIAVDPRSITLHLEAPRATAQNVFAGVIAEMVPEPPYGERVRIILDSEPPLVAEITEHSVQTMSLRPGLRVYASFKAFAARAYR